MLGSELTNGPPYSVTSDAFGCVLAFHFETLSLIRSAMVSFCPELESRQNRALVIISVPCLLGYFTDTSVMAESKRVTWRFLLVETLTS